MHFVYIIYSNDLNKFYVGETSDIEVRIERHGKDKSKFTGKAKDWKLIWSVKLINRTEV